MTTSDGTWYSLGIFVDLVDLVDLVYFVWPWLCDSMYPCMLD